mmetsp:Transcript_10737/g.39783  ORF Transcript_10737/g.39783 Transcript_10737/m.39783 type:complete len:205 (-) Transcript_10737:202-816(-)
MKLYALPLFWHSLTHRAAHVPLTFAASFSVNPNPTVLRCSASYAEILVPQAWRHAGTHAGSISSVFVILPATSFVTHTRFRATGSELDLNDPVDAPCNATAALVGPPGAKLPPSPGTRNRCWRSAITSTHASAVNPFFRATICLPVSSSNTSMTYFLYTLPNTLNGSTGSFSSGLSKTPACAGVTESVTLSATAATPETRRRYG